VEQVHVVRHKVLVEGRSVRWVAREQGHSRNTVRKYLRMAEPKRQESGPRPHRVLSRIEGRVHELLSDRRLTGGKQRWTAPRLKEVLEGEGLHASERTVRRCLSDWRRRRAEVFVPLSYAPGDLAEVDFFEVLVGPPESRRKAWMFLMREMFGPADFACLYERQLTARFAACASHYLFEPCFARPREGHDKGGVEG